MRAASIATNIWFAAIRAALQRITSVRAEAPLIPRYDLSRTH